LQGKLIEVSEIDIELIKKKTVQPFINENSNHVQNGILLRANIHKLFDSGLITVDENSYVQVRNKI
jgi:putative restriction endonuclease